MTFSQAALHLGWDTGQPHAIPERDVADVRRAAAKLEAFLSASEEDLAQAHHLPRHH